MILCGVEKYAKIKSLFNCVFTGVDFHGPLKQGCIRTEVGEILSVAFPDGFASLMGYISCLFFVVIQCILANLILDHFFANPKGTDYNKPKFKQQMILQISTIEITDVFVFIMLGLQTAAIQI